MKTAMQELIDWAISLQYNQQQCTDWIVIKDKAESLLEMEKQQILDAWISTDNELQRMAAEKYYNETYESKGSGMSEKPTNQTEISDEEIEKESWGYREVTKDMEIPPNEDWSNGAKWYREQLKQK